MSFFKCHAEEIYVRVATGEHFFGIDYIRSGHTDKALFHELAYGTVVHEKEWLKKHQPKEASMNRQMYHLVELHSGKKGINRYGRVYALQLVHQLNKMHPKERYAICAV